MQKQNGFTLVELLVVMSLIGLLTIMVMVNFKQGNYTNDLRQAGTELLQRIRAAQQYTTGGSSIRYCGSLSTQRRYYTCADDNDCCQNPGTCTGACLNGVPPEGYGVSIASVNGYVVYADTNDDTQLNEYDEHLTTATLSNKEIHISQFKFNTGNAEIPTSVNQVLIRFSPPEGTTHFYQQNIENTTATTLTFLLTSENTPSCRRVTINRISGQVSEQGGCGL